MMGCKALGLAVLLLAGRAHATELSGQPKNMPSADQALLKRILKTAGLASVRLRAVERTPERQARVMFDLAKQDVEAAKAMYCDAGDTVIDAYKAKRSRDENLKLMTRVLIEQLAHAREIGCLSHIKNDEVYTVDIPLTEVPVERQAALTSAAEASVKEGKLARFLAPPREPEAFHFEFWRHPPKPAAKNHSSKPATKSHPPKAAAKKKRVKKPNSPKPDKAKRAGAPKSKPGPPPVKAARKK